MAKGKSVDRKKGLIDAGVEVAVTNGRWPLAHSDANSIPESTVRRHFGSWGQYKIKVRDEYYRQHGTPEWDVVTRKVPAQREHLLSSLGDAVENSLLQLNALTPLKPRIAKSAKDKKDADQHVIISDVHVGEYNDSSLASGLTNGYSIADFYKSADLLEEKVLFERRLHVPQFNVNKLVVNMLGDIVTGETIFQGQQLQIDRPLLEQIFESAHRFASMLRNWSAAYKNLEVYCIAGNHGRLGKKGEAHYRSNMDYVVYRVIGILLRDCPNIRMFISEGPSLIVDHGGGWRFLLHHGDSIPGSGVSKGNYVSLERKQMSVAAIAGMPIHVSLCGHYHRSGNLSAKGDMRMMVNGSFPGGSQYSVEMLNEAQRPSQLSFMLDYGDGVFGVTDMYLAPRLKMGADEDGIYTPHRKTKKTVW